MLLLRSCPVQGTLTPRSPVVCNLSKTDAENRSWVYPPQEGTLFCGHQMAPKMSWALRSESLLCDSPSTPT